MWTTGVTQALQLLLIENIQGVSTKMSLQEEEQAR
jgi:hypothetical protein